MPFSPSKLVLCHMSKPVILDFALAVKQGQMDGFMLHAIAAMNPAMSRTSTTTRLGWNDYKNAAMIREITQGEG